MEWWLHSNLFSLPSNDKSFKKRRGHFSLSAVFLWESLFDSAAHHPRIRGWNRRPFGCERRYPRFPTHTYSRVVGGNHPLFTSEHARFLYLKRARAKIHLKNGKSCRDLKNPSGGSGHLCYHTHLLKIWFKAVSTQRNHFVCNNLLHPEDCEDFLFIFNRRGCGGLSNKNM